MKPQEAYALWAPAYPPAPHNPLMEVEQQAVLSLLPPLAGHVALDAGCGTGRYLRHLRARGAARAIGCDASAAMLARAEGGGLVQGDLRALPFATRSVDAIVCGLALNDLNELALAASELARLLRPGGSLVASLLHPRGAAEGWRRTFDTPGGVCEVDACWHSLDDVQRGCAGAGLTIDRVFEPGIGGTPRGLPPPHAGEGRPEGVPPHYPVALVFRAMRT